MYLRQLRKLKHLTLEDVSKNCNISISQLSILENGQTHISPKFLWVLEEFFGEPFQLSHTYQDYKYLEEKYNKLKIEFKKLQQSFKTLNESYSDCIQRLQLIYEQSKKYKGVIRNG